MPAFEILTTLSAEELKVRHDKLREGENPIDLKRELAKMVVTWAFGPEAAEIAAAHFTNVHQQHQRPEDMPVLFVGAEEISLVDVLMESNIVESKTEARRQIEQGAVRVEDEQVTDIKASVKPTASGVVVQKGKRHFVSVKKQ